MPDDNRKSEPDDIDPAKLEQLLQIELIQKRAQWQQAKAHRGSFRMMSFFFLFLMIVTALFAFYVFFSPDRVRELRASDETAARPSPAPTASGR